MTSGAQLRDMRDVADRLGRAAHALQDHARHAEEQGMDFEASRLRGKYEGVRLALSYVDEYLRSEHVPSP